MVRIFKKTQKEVQPEPQEEPQPQLSALDLAREEEASLEKRLGKATHDRAILEEAEQITYRLNPQPEVQEEPQEIYVEESQKRSKVPFLGALALLGVVGSCILYSEVPVNNSYQSARNSSSKEVDDQFKFKGVGAWDPIYDCNSIRELEEKIGNERYYVENANTGVGDYFKSGEKIGIGKICFDGQANSYSVFETKLPSTYTQTQEVQYSQESVKKSIEAVLEELKAEGNL